MGVSPKFTEMYIQMQLISNKTQKRFSSKRGSVDQAIKILKRNGIQTNEDQAGVILNFLYLIAQTCNNIKDSAT